MRVAEPGAQQPRIIVVDDDRVRGQTLLEVIEDEGVPCVWVGSASMALQHLALGKFEIVLTAMRMPDVNGIELLHEVEALDPNLPVILLAETSERSAAAEAVRARAFDVLWHPIDDALLISAVRRGIRIRGQAVAAHVATLAQLQRLERRSALLSVLFEEGSDGVLTWASDGRLVDLSPSILALTGADLDAVLAGGSVELFEPEPFGGSIEDQIPELARAPGSQLEHEVVVRTGDGPAPARLTLTVCELPPSEEGEPPVRWVMGVLQPPRREDLRERLRRADRLAGAAMISTGAAHEIKNDLTPLLTCMSLLDEANIVDSDLADVLSEAKQCVRRIAAGVERILAPLRTQRPRRGVVDVAEVVRNSVAFVRRSGQERRPKVALEIVGGLPGVLARPDDLHQIVNNLVTNAFEAMSAAPPSSSYAQSQPPEILVELRQDQDTGDILLAVHDVGPGIDPASQARVFEPFYTTKGTGTGLGLTVVRDLVRELGGDLSIVSVPAITGTCVRVRLPSAG